MSNIVDAITRKERAATDAAYERGRAEASNEWREVVEEQERFHARELREARQEGMREGYSSRVKDEADARRNPTRVTAWSVGGNDDDTIDIHITGNQLDAEEAHDIAAALWHHVNVIQNRRARR